MAKVTDLGGGLSPPVHL